MNAPTPRAKANLGMAGAVPASGWREPAMTSRHRPLSPALSPSGGEGERIDPDHDHDHETSGDPRRGPPSVMMTLP